MNFNDEQKLAIDSKEPLVVISAGAGSGKTRVLTERYVSICEAKLNEKLGHKPNPIAATVDEIVAITFTEKAAREMKDRIRGRIEEKREGIGQAYTGKEKVVAEKFWQEQKEALDGALITTFHSFCHKLLHEFAFVADIPPSFSVLDDVQSKLLHLEIFEEMFDSPQLHGEWRPIYNYYTRNQLKEAIKSVYSQMKEIISAEDTLEVFFDSETIIQLQLATIEQNRKDILIRFYQEARSLVMNLESGDKASKKIEDHFHQVGDLSLVDPSAIYLDLEEAMPKRVSSKWQETNPALYELYEHLYKPLKKDWKLLQCPTELEIEELKEIIQIFAKMIAVFHQKYDEAKRERAAMDFSDLQQKAIALLENQVVQENCRQKFKHMMIDEFQDTNQLQMNMLKRIKPRFQFVVGDGKQSIYRFRGADVSLMKELVDVAKTSTNADFINMSTNYRTCDSIIQFVNLAFEEIMGQQDSGEQPSYKINYTKIDSHRKSEEERQCRVELIKIQEEVAELENEEEEATEDQSEYEIMANRMLEILTEKRPIVSDKEKGWRPPQWRDFAVLIQARTKLTKLEKALKDKGIPYVVYGGIGFYEKQEVRDMLTLLQWLNRPWEPLYILALLRCPLYGVSIEGFLTLDDCLEEDMSLASYIYEGIFLKDEKIDKNLSSALTKLKAFYEEWVPYTPQASLREYLDELFCQSGLKEMLLLQRNNTQQVRNVEKLMDVLAQFQTASLDELLSQVKQLAALSEKEGEAEVELAEGNMVHIMTVHASKGLEFPIVMLPDLAKGNKADSGVIRFDKDVRLVLQYEKEKENEPLKSPDKKTSPSFNSIKALSKDQGVEEAKRLFYVAVTRAKDYLVLLTIDKQVNHSWYAMLQEAIDENGKLPEYIKEITEVSEQERWLGLDEEYDPPKLSIDHSIPVTFSVSEVMQFLNDPIKYYYKYVIKAEDHWLFEDKPFTEASPLSSATLGTIVHRACELMDNGFSENEAKQEALAILDDDMEKRLYESELDSLISRYNEITQLQLGVTVANEWTFAVEIEGVEIIGEIDKVVKKDDSYHLIDLKTNKTNDLPSLITYYQPQLYLYKLAFEEKMKLQVNFLSLFFIRAGLAGFKTVEIAEENEVKIRNAIKLMKHFKLEKASKEQYEKVNANFF